eukprot:6639372-Pyramimonas_sp.AAC.1
MDNARNHNADVQALAPLITHGVPVAYPLLIAHNIYTAHPQRTLSMLAACPHRSNTAYPSWHTH